MSKEPIIDSVPTDPEETEAFWESVIDYGFYTYDPETPWDDVARQAGIHGRQVSQDDLGWGIKEFRFIVLPETRAGRHHCPICERDDPRLRMSAHHLRTRKADKVLTERLCRECHSTVHRMFTNKELADPSLGLDSVEGLLANPEYAKAVAFHRKLEPGRKPAIHTSKNKGRRN